MRGVGPIIKEESSMLRAGVTKGFLVDLNRGRDMSAITVLCFKKKKGRWKMSYRLIEVFCLFTESALARFDVVGGFFEALV